MVITQSGLADLHFGMQNSSSTKYSFIFLTCIRVQSMKRLAQSGNASVLYMHRTRMKMFVTKHADRSWKSTGKTEDRNIN
jgi:hypothetical protein